MDAQLKNLIEKINAAPLHRTATLARAEDAKEGEHRYTLSFSSEAPYERFFGVEILGHKANEVEMDWLKGGTAPLLLDHDRTKQIGVIEKAKIESGRGSAVVRFGKSALAQEIAVDVAEGIRSNVSVGYYVEEMTLMKKGSNGAPDEYRVTRWKPFEVSIVSVPADETVGVGRSKEETPNTPQVKIMSEENKGAAAKPEDVLKQERARMSEIRELGKVHNLSALAEKAIDNGTDLDAFRKEVLFHVAKRTPQINPVEDLGKQQKKDLSRFSFVKMLHEISSGTGLTGIERELHEEAVREGKANGRPISGYGIPYLALVGKRDLTIGESGHTGENFVATQVTGFIDALRNKLVLQGLGASMLTGLTSNIAIPKLSGSTGAWATEAGNGTEKTQTMSQVALSPKRCNSYSDISKQLLIQSTPDVEMMVRNDLVTAMAQALEIAAINGGGTNEPTGILTTSNIGSVAGGTNGLAPTWAHIIELESDVAVANADVGALAYLTNAKVRGKLKQTVRVSSTDSRFIWGDGEFPLNGYRCGVSNAVPSTLDKGTSTGVCSAILFGNFADLILAQFGGLDIVVDPYTQATNALVRVTVNAYMDVAVRNAASFSAMQDALTT